MSTSSLSTIQHEDLFNMAFLNGGNLSPDGTQVVYYVSQVDTQADKEFMTVYLLDIASGKTRQMTNGQARDTIPQWSPDGKSIAFISDRNDKPQVYMIPIDGGEARQLTHFNQGVDGFAWSPDGTKIALTAGPDYGEDDPPDLTKDAYRVTRTVYRFDGIGYLNDKIHNLYVMDVASGDVQQLTDDDTNNINPRWSPDGTKILYEANMQTDAIRTLFGIHCLIDLNGNKQSLLEDWGMATNANFTPDGNKIVFAGTPNGLPIGSKADLYVLNINDQTIKNRSAGLDVGIAGGTELDMPVAGLRSWYIKVSSDGESAFVPVQTGGTVHIYQIALTGDEHFKALTSGDSVDSLVDVADNKLLFARTTLNDPFNLWYKNLDDGSTHQLTRLNADYLSDISLPETEHLLFQGVDGVQVEGWYMKPPVGSAPYPTILYIHGGPHGAYGNGFHFDFQMLAGAGYGVLFLNHRASTGYGDSFSTAIKGDWGNLDYNDLMSGVDYVIEKGWADVDRLGVCGTSGGGNLSCWIVGQTHRFKAAIPQNPVSNWRSFYGTSDIGIWFAVEQMGGHPHQIPEIYEKCSPISYAHNCQTPTLMVQSEHDWRCPAEQSEQFYSVLKANGCITGMLRQPGGYHGASVYGAINLRREHNTAMLDWFARYV